MNRLVRYIKKIIHFISVGIWEMPHKEISKIRKFLIDVTRTIVLAIKGYLNNDLGIRSAGLTYSTAFAIVPLLALIIAIAKGFGVEKLIQDFLESTFAAQSDIIPTIMDFVEQYLQTMRNGLFIGVGIIILIVSVMSLFMTVESSLNEIWQVKKSRSIVKQFTTYFTGLVLLPFLIAIISGFSIYFHTVFSNTFLFELFSPITKVLIRGVPYFLSIIFFTLLYIIVPNTKVKFKNGLLAGVIAGISFQFFQFLYITGQINLTRYNAVYGGFAAIPLLLFWIKISCQMFLIGAEISYISQNLRIYDFVKDAKAISSRYKEYLTLFVAYVIIKRFKEKKAPTTSSIVVAEYSIPTRLVHQILRKLKEAGLVVTVKDNEQNIGYQPAHDINSMSLTSILESLNNCGSEFFLDKNNDELRAFNEKLNLFYNKRNKVTEEIFVKDF